MSCQARILSAEYPLEGVSPPFHTTTFCGKVAKKRLNLGEDVQTSCDDCFRRYASGKEWYGWMDGTYPPEARVVGSQAFYLCHGKPVVVAKLPSQVKIDGCATCWRTSFKRTTCQTCDIELCRACASVPPAPHVGDFCKTCVPKWNQKAEPKAEPQAEPEAEPKAEPKDEVDLCAEFAQLKLEPQQPPTLTYPIRDDIKGLSVEELMALHTPLVAWMKEAQTKIPRRMVPYYRYRMRIEALVLQKK